MTILYAVIGVVVGGGIVWFLLQNKAKTAAKPEDNQELLKRLNQLAELARVVDSKLSESTKTLNESLRVQFGESQKLVKDITKELTQVQETGKRVEGFANQLQSLQDILKNPKQR